MSFHRQMNIYGFRMDRRESNQGMHGTLSPALSARPPGTARYHRRCMNKLIARMMMAAAKRRTQSQCPQSSSKRTTRAPPCCTARTQSPRRPRELGRGRSSVTTGTRAVRPRHLAADAFSASPRRTCFARETRHSSTKCTSCTCREAEHSWASIRRRAVSLDVRIRRSIRCTRWSTQLLRRGGATVLGGGGATARRRRRSRFRRTGAAVRRRQRSAR